MLEVRFPSYMFKALRKEAEEMGVCIPWLVIHKLKQFYPDPRE